MALTDSNTGSGFYMPVAPAYGGGGFGSGLGGDGWWILLLLLAFGGGWGFGGFGGMGGAMMGAGMMDGFGLYPWRRSELPVRRFRRRERRDRQCCGPG